jgi:UDP-3-O-[3-hydroxymyristoyl] glucosamine N-acyltransferase
VAAGQDVSGSPALPQRQWLQSMTILSKLPELYRRLKRLEQQMAELAARSEDKEPES